MGFNACGDDFCRLSLRVITVALQHNTIGFLVGVQNVFNATLKVWDSCAVVHICSGRDTKFIKAGSKTMYEGRANDDRRSSMGWGMLRTGTHSSRRGLLLVLTAHEVGLPLGGGSSSIHVMASGSQLHHRDGQTDYYVRLPCSFRIS